MPKKNPKTPEWEKILKIIKGYEPVKKGNKKLGYDLVKDGRTEFGFYWEYEDMEDCARKIAKKLVQEKRRSWKKCLEKVTSLMYKTGSDCSWKQGWEEEFEKQIKKLKQKGK